MNLADCIETRRTIKVFSDNPLAAKPLDEAGELLMHQLMSAAYWAPFHKPCEQSFRQGGTNAIMPWRFYILDAAECRKMALWLKKKNLSVGRMEAMLHAADYLILATWTPDCAKDKDHAGSVKKSYKKPGKLFKGSIENMEHIAASGAAIQNLLLTATSLGIENYWSSGGPLKRKKVFKKLGININEILLGSIFLFPGNNVNEVSKKISKDDSPLPTLESVTSKMRDKRGEVENSYRWVNLD